MFIWNWLINAERHAVDTILADFHNIVDRLKASAEKHAADAIVAAEAATHYTEISAAASAEAERAKTVAMSIASLVSGRGI